MLKEIDEITRQKPIWIFLLITALGLELSALFFQYVLELKPCIMCIYQRLAIIGVSASALLPVVFFNAITRALGYAGWLVSSVWGVVIALEHVEIQSGDGGGFYSCDIVPNFPQWMPLHEWVPFLFEATGDCSEIVWQFAGASMPKIMVFVFSCFILVCALVLINKFVLMSLFPESGEHNIL